MTRRRPNAFAYWSWGAGILALILFPDNESVIQGLRRVSKPGQRVYSAYNNIPKVRGSFGITILSTSKGIMTDAQAKADKIGGELLCQVW